MEQINGVKVVHIYGTPYERGYQHGTILKELVQQNINNYSATPRDHGERIASFKAAYNTIVRHIPKRITEELHGVANGAEVPFEKVLFLNLFPEMFHCSNLVLQGKATKNHSLYHARVLDYSLGDKLYDTAVIFVSHPSEPSINGFINISYAGFIGCVTGMNDKKISVGEVGGKGYGLWDGIPMAFLMKLVLEETSSADQAFELFSSSPRTCEYYYTIADGNTNTAYGIYATPSQCHKITSGTTYSMLVPENTPLHYGKNGYNDKFFLSNCTVEQTANSISIFDETKRLTAITYSQPADCIVITGFSTSERYNTAIDRINKYYGNIDCNNIQKIIKSPVALPSNIHNAIFHPSTMELWLALAPATNKPAYDQPYIHLSF